MTIIYAGIAFALFFIALPTKELIDNLKLLKNEDNKNHKFQVFSGAKIMIIAQGVLLIFSFVLIFITGLPTYNLNADGTWIAIGIALIGSSIGSIITALNHRRLFYDDKGFLLNGHYISFKSIKNFKKKNSILGVAQVETLRGETMTLTTSCAAKLQELAKTKKK